MNAKESIPGKSKQKNVVINRIPLISINSSLQNTKFKALINQPTQSDLKRSQNQRKYGKSDWHLFEEVVCRPVVILHRQATIHIELLRLGSNTQSSPHDCDSTYSQWKSKFTASSAETKHGSCFTIAVLETKIHANRRWNRHSLAPICETGHQALRVQSPITMSS